MATRVESERVGPPAGKIGAAVVLVGCIALAVLYFAAAWPLGVVFFLAVGLLTFVLGGLSAYAAIVAPREHHEPLRFPEAFRDVEDYFRWLTPLAFTTGMIFAHFYWH